MPENVATHAGYKYIHAGKVSASYDNSEKNLAYKANASVNDFVVGVTASF